MVGIDLRDNNNNSEKTSHKPSKAQRRRVSTSLSNMAILVILPQIIYRKKKPNWKERERIVLLRELLRRKIRWDIKKEVNSCRY